MAPQLAIRTLRRALALGIVVAAVAGLVSPVAEAATVATVPCTTRTTAQKFLKVDGDWAYYFTAPSGTFESGASGWTLTNASVSTGQEPSTVNGAGTKSLLIQSGGKAVSPIFCDQYGEYSMRFFYSGTPGARIHLHLDVTNTASNMWGPLDWEMTVPASGWAAANGLQLPYLYSQGQENVQITYTAIGGSVRVDDIEIDPFRSI